MATSLDLQEQEQIDQLKAFWKQYGNLITWILIAVLGAYAAWNGWNWWQREQGFKAGALYGEVERAAQAGEADKVAQAFNDLRERHGGTTYAAQGALLAAKVQAEKGQADAARATLTWAADKADGDAYRDIARLRLAAVLMDQKQYDEAIKALDGVKGDEFKPLAADRRGDVLQLQGKPAEAKAAYQTAWAGLDAAVEYRQVVDAKLTALGAAPAPAASASAASGVAQ
ncbi:YfgM family protein [Azohydromonas lata]|uniref:Ancillary SecYEG translocon subunit n=1 Tax=Azohydromonas lata TaxID=45677 RepID=A0ABU5IJU9_9BURK|nr:tetratricopeptide repeat protein [Azohydromonas lata]MDZ5459182.1 tetratricopeptide repeat protein [Azohydromonas lata]